jgi:hypothetical protein
MWRTSWYAVVRFAEGLVLQQHFQTVRFPDAPPVRQSDDVARPLCVAPAQLEHQQV